MITNNCPKAFNEIMSPFEVALPSEQKAMHSKGVFTMYLAKFCIRKPGMSHREIQKVAYDVLGTWSRWVRQITKIFVISSKDLSQQNEGKREQQYDKQVVRHR